MATEYKLEDIMGGAANKAVPSAENVIQQTQESMPAKTDFEMVEISPEDRKEIDRIKNSLDVRDTNAVIQFGNVAQRNITTFSDSILQNVKTKDSGHVGELLNDLVGKVQDFDKSNNSFLTKIPFLGKLVDNSKKMIRGYDSLSTQVTRIESELDKAQHMMLKDIKIYDTLYKKNYEYFKSLQLYIQAGEEKLVELREVALPSLKQQAIESNDMMANQAVADFEQMVDRFEKKLHDLKISKTISIQTAPQIRLIQNNDKMLIDRVQTTINNTLPLWKMSVCVSLGLNRQAQVLKLNRSVTDMTNQLIKKNAEMLKTNSIETSKESERGIVDIESLKEANESLITTIEETLRIQQEGRAKRQQVEQELAQIESRLKDTLYATTTQGRANM